MQIIDPTMPKETLDNTLVASRLLNTLKLKANLTRFQDLTTDPFSEWKLTL